MLSTTKHTKSTKEEKAFDPLSGKVIGCAIEVHRNLDPGLLESAYQKCLAYELNQAGIKFEMEVPVPVNYKTVSLDCGYRIDVLVEETIVLELKAVDKLTGLHEAQLITYMKLANISIGLLLNFNEKTMKDGIKRYVV